MKISLVFALIIAPILGLSQTASNAYAIGVDGVKAIEAGEFNEGIKLLKKAWSLEPGEYDYPFELGRAHFLDGQEKKAEKFLFPLQYHANVQPDLYVLLADCYKKIDETKKSPDVTRKKEFDALRYGIQKLPESGVLYLEMGKRKLELEENVDALSVFETGIKNAPNFTENYFWAAKLMKASRNYLWAWIYAELYLNISDNVEMNRTAARIVSESMNKVLSENWMMEPEKMDQGLKFLLSGDCVPSEAGLERILQFRICLMNEWKNTKFPMSVILERTEQLKKQGFLEAYLGSVVLEADKEAFLTWLASNGKRYEAYRKWRFYNPMMITEPVIRVQ